VAPTAITPDPGALVYQQSWSLIAPSDVGRDPGDDSNRSKGVCEKMIAWVAWK